MYYHMHLVYSSLERLKILCHAHHVPIKRAYLQLMVIQIILYLILICLLLYLFIDGAHIELLPQLDHLCIPLLELLEHLFVHDIDLLPDQCLHLLALILFVGQQILQLFLADLVLGQQAQVGSVDFVVYQVPLDLELVFDFGELVINHLALLFEVLLQLIPLGSLSGDD